MKEYKIKPLIFLDAQKWSLRMCAFWRIVERPHYMNSGFLIEYTDKTTNETSLLECLDDDHIWSDLEDIGLDEENNRFDLYTKEGLQYHFNLSEEGNIFGDMFNVEGDLIDTFAMFNIYD